ncbi:MAG: gliding motility-associated C-terminal domain-containing protein [Bacteroidetes bacterium]|nr:gliding motility-associated C-terminal domain-containing protein [Bacteroidota bacterium]
MKQILRRLILLISLASTAAILPQKASATHLVGSDISYACLGGNTYRVELTFYRDCKGSLPPNGVGIVFRSASCNQFFTDTLLQVAGTGGEITYPCPTVITSCEDPLSTIPGIQQYRYSGIITLPMQCADWVISWSYCCRNCDITTLNLPSPCVVGSNPGMYIETTLDNLNFTCNSSPQFSNVPVAFLCVGQNFTYNHGVTDPDGDSLVYSLVDPLQDSLGSIMSVPFLPGYTGINPISSSPAITIDPQTGDIVMTPTQIEIGVLAVLVQEYRNGVLIGSVVRDMEFYVRNCTNNLPTATGINGTSVRDTTVCPGQQLCFDINSDDIDAGQIVTMTWNQGITGATFTTSGFPHPTGNFCWTPPAGSISTNPYTFTVTVLDDACPNSGFQTYSFNVFVNSPISALNSTDISCHGLTDGTATAVPSSSTGTYTYLWTPGNFSTATISNLTSGIYTVTVSEATTGCVATQTVTITDPPQLTASTSVSSSPCSGTNTGVAIVVASGGTPGYSYSWDTNPITTEDTATGLAAGVYHITITDSRGCVTTDSVTVSPSSTALVVSVDSVSGVLNCFGDTTGFATVSVSGGTPGYTYIWNTNPVQTGPTAINLAAGSYVVTITDTVGCIGTDTISINSAPQLVLTGSSTNSSCGVANGTATVTVSGGTPNYQYAWDTLSATTASISGIPSGIYNVEVTDANGCISSVDVPVSDNIPVPFAYVIDDVSCNGYADGTALVVPDSSLTAPFTYTWNTVPPQFTDTAVSLTAGIYIAGVQDANGCLSFDTVQVREPAPIVVTVLSSDASCFGDSTGIASAQLVSGGTAPYTYSWTPYGGSSSIATNLVAGSYDLFVIDAAACSTFVNVQIDSPPQIAVTVTSTIQPTCYAGSNGSIDISVAGGLGSYNYAWNPGGATSQDISNVDAGIYVVTVTDQNNCSTQQTVNLNQPSPVLAIAGPDTAMCSGTSIQLAASLLTGQSGVWSSTTGITFAGITDPNTTAGNLSPGFNQVTWTVTDANGCTASDDVTVFNYTTFVADAGVDTAFCGLAQIQLNATAYTGFNGIWSSSGNSAFNDPTLPNATADLLDYGTDTLTWIISNGACTGADSRIVTADQPVSSDAGAYQELCIDHGQLLAIGLTYGQGSWTIQAPGQGSIVNPNNDTTDVSALQPGQTVFVWQVTNGTCQSADTVSVDYDNQCDIDLPTGFSPNDDTYNDGYEIKGIEGYPNNSFRVFNRWGNEVYAKENYVNTDWKGQNNNGEELPEGTYFVVLTIKNSEIKKNTYVDLRRYVSK